MLSRGGTNGNSIFPGFVDENRIQYENNVFPQLQLFEHVRVDNNSGSAQQQKLNNNNSYYPTESILIGSASNPNPPVSTGLKLSCEEDERNSTLTSTADNIAAARTAPLGLSLGNAVRTEIDRQTDEFSQFIKLQEQAMLNGVVEMSRRHTISLLNSLVKGMNQKLQEKDLEIEGMNRKNKELGERMKHVAMEAQSWHCKAKYNETVINALKANIHQLMLNGNNGNRAHPHREEGLGESEVDDAMSCSDHPERGSSSSLSRNWCRACGAKEVSVLMMPCRHLCLCVDCEGVVSVCPICKVVKSASLRVYM